MDTWRSLKRTSTGEYLNWIRQLDERCERSIPTTSAMYGPVAILTTLRQEIDQTMYELYELTPTKKEGG